MIRWRGTASRHLSGTCLGKSDAMSSGSCGIEENRSTHQQQHAERVSAAVVRANHRGVKLQHLPTTTTCRTSSGRICAAAHIDEHVWTLKVAGGGVVTPALEMWDGGATRPCRDSRRAIARAAGDAVEARGLDRLGQGHRWQIGGELPCQHRLASPRGAEYEDVVVRTPASPSASPTPTGCRRPAPLAYF
jgi:hypothetical protein